MEGGQFLLRLENDVLLARLFSFHDNGQIEVNLELVWSFFPSGAKEPQFVYFLPVDRVDRGRVLL